MTDRAESTAADAPDPAAALAARLAAFRREQVAVDYANRGLSVPEIAARLGVPEDDARKKLRRTLARMLPESPEVFAALQISRLNEALLVAFSAMAEGGLKAVDRVLRILRALDRCHAAARALVRPAAGEAEPAAPRPPSPAQAPAAVRERNQTGPQPFEKPQNRSQIRDPAPPPGGAPSRAAAPTPGPDEAGSAWRRPAPLPRLAPAFPGAAAAPSGGTFAWPVVREALGRGLSLATIHKGGVSLHALAAAGV